MTVHNPARNSIANRDLDPVDMTEFFSPYPSFQLVGHLLIDARREVGGVTSVVVNPHCDEVSLAIRIDDWGTAITTQSVGFVTQLLVVD